MIISLHQRKFYTNWEFHPLKIAIAAATMHTQLKSFLRSANEVVTRGKSHQFQVGIFLQN